MERRHSPTDDLRDLRTVFCADVGLSTPERAVLAVLLLHRNGLTGRLDPSVRTIAEETGLGRRTVLRILPTLEDHGFISRQQKAGFRTRYTLTLPRSAPKTPVPERHKGHTGTGVVPGRHGTSVATAPERTKEWTKEWTKGLGDEVPPEADPVLPILSHLPRRGRERVYPPEFEGAFTALPPRHHPHPKAEAYRAWRARAKDVEEIFQLEAAADAYRDDCERREVVGTEYVLQASTFFGPGERWTAYSGIALDHGRAPHRFGTGAARIVS